MKSGTSLRRMLCAVAAVVVGGIASVGVTPAAHAAAAPLPDLQVSVAVTPQKATYAVGDVIVTTFVVKNAGTLTATNVRPGFGGLGGHNELGITRMTPAPDQPFDLGPGATKSLPWTGTINHDAFAQGQAYGGGSFTNDAGEANQADNGGSFLLAVPGGKGTLAGKVLIDSTGKPNPPALPGAAITVTGNDNKITFTATSDSAGHYSIAGMPTGPYTMAVAGWTIVPDDDFVWVVADKVNNGTIFLEEDSHTTPRPTGTATGGGVPALPVTGSRTGLMFAVGAGVLAVGAVAVVIGRRRRNRFVTPD